MRIVLALLMCWGVAFAQDTTKYFKSVDYGWNWQRGKFRAGLILPTDTTNNKLGIAQIGATCFAWSGVKWNSIGSTDTSFLVRYYRKNQVDSAIAANYPALTLQDVTTNGKTTTDTIIAASFKRTGGTSSQFLKANGSVDNSTYLTSASLTGYVPYTGATSDVDLGLFVLNAASVKINGTNGNGHLHLRHQASDATATGQSTVLFANSNGDLKWKNAGNYYTTLQTYKNNADRVYTYQNKSYTLADSTTLADSVSALRTSINTKGIGTVTSITLGRGITGSSPITSTGTIGLDTTRNYTWSGVNTFSPSVTAVSSSAIGTVISPSLTASANGDILSALTVSPTFNNGIYSSTYNAAMRITTGIMLVNNSHATYGLTSVSNGQLRVMSSDAAASGRGGTIGLGGNGSTANINFAGITGTREDGTSDRGNMNLFTNGTSNSGGVFIPRLNIGSDGNIVVNPASNNANYVVHFAVRATSGQSVNIMEIRNSSNTATSFFNKFGGLGLVAGVASASGSPLKFTSGTNLTTVENGAVEYDGTDYFASANNTRYTIDKTLRASATLDFASTAASTSTDLTITVTGAALNDIVSFGVPNGSVNANSCYTAWVSATNTVTIRFNNYQTIGAIDPASGTFKVSVIK